MAAARLGLQGVELGLSHRPGVGAWSWRSGRIRLTRGLVDLVDDDQLAAALAHEAGHLEGDGRHDGAGLQDTTDAAVEARADRLGCRRLAARGIAPRAMIRLLEALDAAFAWRDDPHPFAARAAAARAACGD